VGGTLLLSVHQLAFVAEYMRSAQSPTSWEAMNTYLHGITKGQLVLTCRSTPYVTLEDAGLWAQDASRIDIAPVSLAATEAFVTARAHNPARWEPVLNALRAAQASPLARGLSTPWRLTVAVAVYDERHPNGSWVRDPVDLLEPTLRTPEQIRDHLLNLFILAASSTGGATAPYTRLQVRTWLTERGSMTGTCTQRT
jgi:hypothetical protein